MSSSLSRACIEISNSIKGLRLGGRSLPTDQSTQAKSQSCSVNATSPTGKDAMNNMRPSDFTSSITRALKSATNKVRYVTIDFTASTNQAHTAAVTKNGNSCMAEHYLLKREMADPWQDDTFLCQFFSYFTPSERCQLALVCHRWKDVLYKDIFWKGLVPVYDFKLWNGDVEGRCLFYKSLELRGFPAIALKCVTDADVSEFLNNFPNCQTHIHSLHICYSNLSDTGLENAMDKMNCVTKLVLSGCNEITESALWTCLNCRITSLSISDCINIADDSVGAIAQLLPALTELSIQAYHLTDTSLSFFSAKQSQSLTKLQLLSCWEITNHGIVNVVNALPNLTILSVSGCSKITDDAVELIAEKLRQLTTLDLAWCPRITDAALEYIACDLAHLEELVLDRCNHVTDIGVGYLSTMTSLRGLYLRWCSQIRDFGLQHLYTMKNLRSLSLSGCNLVTSCGLSGLTQMSGLQELELTNCHAAGEIIKYLRHSMPTCTIIE